MKFLLDENVHRGLVKLLTGFGHEAKLSPKGLSNGAVRSLAISEERVLVTHDKDFAKAFPPPKHPGIILLKILPRRFIPLKNSFEQFILQKRSPDSFAGMLFILYEDRCDEFPFTMEEFPFKE